MQGLKDLHINYLKILKIAAIVLGAIILLSIFVNLVMGPIFSQSKSTTMSKLGVSSQYSSPSAGGISNYKYDSDASLSVRNVAEESAPKAASNITSAENYEVTQYSAVVETGKLKEDCALISGLKARDYVIFENSNISEHQCYFSFKIEKDKIDEVLPLVKNLKPRELSQNIESIKQQVEDFTSREEILKNKQASIDETLKSALSAYNEITILATKTNNADSLAKVIESKISILERLTAERLQVSADLENLGRSKARQLDRLKYTNFYVDIYENKIFDWQALKDSWIASAKQFVNNINQVLDDLSLGLVTVLLQILKFLLYIFIILIVAKYSWALAKKIWKK